MSELEVVVRADAGCEELSELKLIRMARLVFALKMKKKKM